MDYRKPLMIIGGLVGVVIALVFFGWILTSAGWQ